LNQFEAEQVRLLTPPSEEAPGAGRSAPTSARNVGSAAPPDAGPAKTLLAVCAPGRFASSVANGIAYDRATGRVLVTGKYWPFVFQLDSIPGVAPPPALRRPAHS
jgi:hypothetical protein